MSIKLTVTSPNKKLEFYVSYIGKVTDCDNLIVTEINPTEDSITDYVFKSVTHSVISDTEITFVSKENTTSSGIFALVSFMYEESTFMKVFEHYDGEILAYNGEDILMTERENLNPDFDTIYVITWYNNKELLV